MGWIERRDLGMVVLAALALVACRPPGGGDVTGITGMGGDPGAAVRVEAAGQVVSNGGGGIIANNAGSLVGKVKGPAAGIISNNVGRIISNNVGRLVSNNSAGLVSNNSAGLVSNNSAGIISNNVGRYGLLDLATQTTPAAGARVEAVDATGRVLSAQPATTDAQGGYVLSGLAPSGPTVYVRATYEVEGHPITLMAAASAPREPGTVEASADPATTIVAKKVSALVARGAVPAEAVDVAVTAKMAAAIAPNMTDVAVAAATLQAPDAAAGTFDAMLRESADLKAAVAAAAPGPAAALTAESAPTSAGAPIVGVVTSLAGAAEAAFADGPGADARFNYPYGIAVATDGTVYVADSTNHRIRRFRLGDPSLRVATVAGSGQAGFVDGTGGEARFSSPRAIALDPSAATPTLYVADAGNQRVRRITLDAAGVATVATLAGGAEAGYADGAGAAARFKNPRGIAVDRAGVVYLADSENHCLRRITPDGAVTTVAGAHEPGEADGPLGTARFKAPYGLAFDDAGRLLVADPLASAVRRVTFGAGGAVATLAGGGGSTALDHPVAVAAGPGDRVWVAEFRRNRVVAIEADGAITPVAGGGEASHVDGPAAAARFSGPYGLAWSAGRLLVADTSNHRIRQLGLQAP